MAAGGRSRSPAEPGFRSAGKKWARLAARLSHGFVVRPFLTPAFGVSPIYTIVEADEEWTLPVEEFQAPRDLITLLDPGSSLDREVARHVFGAASDFEPSKYSSDDVAAQRLRELLEARGMIRCTFELWEGTWYCTWWTVPTSAPRERLASGSGPTRALSFCRACLNLPGWTVCIEPPRQPFAGEEARTCESCGSEERMRGRARAVRLCNVCAWKAGKVVQDRRFGSRG